MARILIVDDDEAFIESFQMVLNVLNHYVRSVNSCESALDVYAKDLFDFIFLDLKMSGLDGIECCRIFKKKKYDAKVILLTGFSLEQINIDDSTKSDFFAIHRKPINFTEISSILSN